MQEIVYSGFSAVKSRLHYAGQRVLSQDRRNRIKHWQASRRKKWAWLYELMYGKFTAKELVAEIGRRIENDFEILMVHSAYDRLRPMYAGKHQEIIQELMDLCGKERTLVMPAFVLGGNSGDPLEFYRTRVFDAKRTPSEMGLLTEIFRRMPGVIRSLHPTHSVSALGPLAEHLTIGHHFAATPSGRGTPFETMAQKQTAIVGLGVEYYRCMTQIHTAEDLVGDDFPVKFEREHAPVTVIDADGVKFVYNLTIFKTGIAMNCGVVRSLLTREELQEWRFRGVPLFITSAEKVTSRLVEAARRGISVYGCHKS